MTLMIKVFGALCCQMPDCGDKPEAAMIAAPYADPFKRFKKGNRWKYAVLSILTN